MNAQYLNKGYFKVSQFLSDQELAQLLPIIEKFHLNWQQDNQSFYQSQAINSAYLTAPKYLNDAQRLRLFQFICSNKITNLLGQLPFSKAAFMNTQLFFDPVNSEQKNYWHRDPQYHLDLAQQQQALLGPEVVHFRIALRDEPGIELVPNSHKQWDSEQALDVRLERNGKTKDQPLENGVEVSLNKGDLLVFSANMLHRGLYGNDRLAFDILFCEALPELLEFSQQDCFPSPQQRAQLENPSLFVTV